MIVSCSNFGPIKDGSLDLSKNLIIICGANNSGKTYFSYLLYGLFRSKTYFTITKNFIPIVKSSIRDHIEVKDSIEILINIDIVNFIRTQGSDILSSFSDYATDCVLETFPAGSDLSESKFTFSKSFDTEFCKDLFHREFTDSELYKHSKDTNAHRKSIRLTKATNSNHLLVIISSRKEERSSDKLTDLELQILHHAVLKFILKISLNLGSNQIVLFPAERIAIDVFSHDISNARESISRESQSASMNEYASGDPMSQVFFSLLFEATSDNFYAAPIKDAIIQSMSSMMRSDKEGSLSRLGRLIETNILGGVLSFGKEEENYQMKFQSFGGPSVKMQLASSMVKSLAPLVIYLKHQSRIRDIIILDEPEMCLHPSLQRKLAVVLAQAVNEGIKVIVSTHSDFFLREFNNLIMINHDSPQGLQLRRKYLSIGYDSNASLKYRNVGANLFESNTIKEMECSETGFSMPIIDDVIEAQNEASQDIYFSLF